MKNISLDKLRTLAAAVADAEQGSKAWDAATDALSDKFRPRCLVTLIDRLQAADALINQYSAENTKMGNDIMRKIVAETAMRHRILQLESLERANAAQDNHINQQQDHIDSLENTNVELGKALCKAQAELKRRDEQEPVGEVVDVGGALLVEWDRCLREGDKIYAAAPAAAEFLPDNLDRALTIMGVALPESKETFNFQAERWTQRLINKVIEFSDEISEANSERRDAQKPVAWRYRTSDINGKPNPRWSFSEEESLMGLYQPLYAAAPAASPVISFYRDGVAAAANYIDQQREAFDNEHGQLDPDTGSFEFGNLAAQEHSGTLAELAEGVRSLHPHAATAAVLPPDNVTYFAFSPDYGFDFFKNKQDAINTAQEEIDGYREDRDDGWDEDVRRVAWGVVVQQAQGFDAQGKHHNHSEHTYQTCEYRLEPPLAGSGDV